MTIEFAIERERGQGPAAKDQTGVGKGELPWTEGHQGRKVQCQIRPRKFIADRDLGEGGLVDVLLPSEITSIA